MEGNNQSMPIIFYMIGLSGHPELQPFFFAIFLIIYIAALLGNIVITTIITSDSRLHTPMYFFLVNLSIMDICCTTAAIPKILYIILSKDTTISYSGCMTQLLIFTSALSAELILLTVMACDRYVAICIPLHYATIMSRRTCIFLAAAVWQLGFLNSMMHTSLILRLTFCQHNILDHFFCEIPPLLNAACSDTYINNVVVIMADFVLGMACFTLTVISYTYIILTILKIRSADKKKKAFSTCASHLTVVSLFYGGVIYTYVRPVFGKNPEADKVMSAVYAVVSPVLNPVIYSLRNKEVINALKKLLGRNVISESEGQPDPSECYQTPVAGAQHAQEDEEEEEQKQMSNIQMQHTVPPPPPPQRLPQPKACYSVATLPEASGTWPPAAHIEEEETHAPTPVLYSQVNSKLPWTCLYLKILMRRS
ncbi:olfactory receptor 13G1-like [Microcaecilia unicolor]|uniref:Olfactory receptor 13G1-like n=1 Tax=Microcaecilia unicolor TaxID=1415580 RepID=A0A6P7WZW2_9AMPH|nr:olfactory receptor 13G1-like [Microcaecilia unicolor]